MKTPSRKYWVLGLAVVVLLIIVIAVQAQSVNRARHPNLAAAQEHIEKALTKLTDAQKANEYDMEGHAAKSKSLLEDALKEIKLAAEAANANKR